MSDTEEGTTGKEFSVDTPAGKLNIKGYHLGNLLQMLAVVVLTLLTYMMWELRAEVKSVAAAMATAISASSSSMADHNKINKALEKVAESQDTVTYVLTLSQAERERLNLRMPDSLRRRDR